MLPRACFQGLPLLCVLLRILLLDRLCLLPGLTSGDNLDDVKDVLHRGLHSYREGRKLIVYFRVVFFLTVMHESRQGMGTW